MPLARASILVQPQCPTCGLMLYYERPWLPTDPPRELTCDGDRGCGTVVLGHITFNWYFDQYVGDALIRTAQERRS